MIRHFEEELKQVKDRLVSMGERVEAMINSAIRCIIDRNAELKKIVQSNEDEVNKTQIEIDEICIALIALQQPAGADLRFITSAMKINSDLERMGDQAVNIIQHSIESAGTVPQPIKDQISQMAERVKAMVKRSLESFLDKDLKTAQAVLESDDDVDNAKDDIYRQLTDFMKTDPDTINRSLDLLLISRNLERIGDHATNIAEDVIYMVAGKDIRHHIMENR
jgi:phosphate transport system protein